MNEGLLLGFSVGSRIGGANNFSHFLSADDTLICCGVYPDHLCNFCCLFLCFEAVSDLRINLAKSELVGWQCH